MVRSTLKHSQITAEKATNFSLGSNSTLALAAVHVYAFVCAIQSQANPHANAAPSADVIPSGDVLYSADVTHTADFSHTADITRSAKMPLALVFNTAWRSPSRQRDDEEAPQHPARLGGLAHYPAVSQLRGRPIPRAALDADVAIFRNVEWVEGFAQKGILFLEK